MMLKPYAKLLQVTAMQVVRKNGTYSPTKTRILKHKAYHAPGAVTSISPQLVDVSDSFTEVSKRSAIIYNR
jgi:hypothetical protein